MLHNAHLLQHHGYNLASALQHQQHSPMTPSSKFKAVDILQQLCQEQQYLNVRVDYSQSNIPEDMCLTKFERGNPSGNHKSASNHPAVLQRLVKDDISRGFILPISVPSFLRLQGAEIFPLGVVQQSTIDESGSIVPKFRGTHDQSFPPANGPRCMSTSMLKSSSIATMVSLYGDSSMVLSLSGSSTQTAIL